MAGASALQREPELRDVILEHLRLRGHDSISGVARALAQASGAGRAPHRLTVAGYLKALAEMGVLRENDFGPSKHYALANPEAHQGLHRWVGRAASEMEPQPERSVLLAVAALQELLGRPLFGAEVREAGFQPDPALLERVTPTDVERRRYRQLFERKARPRIEIPERDPLYQVPAARRPGPGQVQALMRRLIVGATGSDHLASSNAASAPGVQKTLLPTEEP